MSKTIVTPEALSKLETENVELRELATKMEARILKVFLLKLFCFVLFFIK